MRMWQRLFNPAGGVFYHYSALKHRNRLWRPFRDTVASWLTDWAPRESRLLLLGASGGYTLTREFLERFTEITCVDPDPFAEKIFRLRHPYVRTSWSHDPNFVLSLTRASGASEFSQALQAFPGHAILFSNILGQLPLISTQQQGASLTLAQLLKEHNWASYHDLISLPQAPLLTTTAPAPMCGPVDLSELIRSLRWPESPAVVIDHLTADLFPGHLHRFSWWRLRDDQSHLIAFVQKEDVCG